MSLTLIGPLEFMHLVCSRIRISLGFWYLLKLIKVGNSYPGSNMVSSYTTNCNKDN